MLLLMVEELLADLATNGLLGVLLVIALVAYYRKDQRLTELQAARLEDMRAIKDEYTTLITGVNGTLDRLVSLIKGREGGGNAV